MKTKEAGDKVKIYRDEEVIYRMSQKRYEEAKNDIKDGYVIIDDVHIPFSERFIISGKLYMTIPSEFVMMAPEAAKIKYPNENRPAIILTNEDGTINITFSFTTDELEDVDDNVEVARNQLARTMVRMNPAYKTISKSVINEGIKIGYFDFVSPVLDGEIYNLTFIFALQGKLVLGCFNCLYSDSEAWLEVAQQMLRSIRVVD